MRDERGRIIVLSDGDVAMLGQSVRTVRDVGRALYREIRLSIQQLERHQGRGLFV